MLCKAAPCILHVEDDEHDVVLLKLAFEKVGITTPMYTVTDGEMAIAYLTGEGQFSDRVRYPLPCLVLLDLKLPKLSGLEVLARIKSNPGLSKLVVVVFSASALPTDIQRAYSLGANSYIEKPSEFERTIEIAHLLKGWWLGFNHFPPSDAPVTHDQHPAAYAAPHLPHY